MIGQVMCATPGPRRLARRAALGLIVLTGVAGLAPAGRTQPGEVPRALAYDAQTRGAVPIPPAERGLQTVVAEPWFKVSDEGVPLEGPAFDRNGNLLFTDAGSGRVFRLAPDRRLSTVVPANTLGLGGLAVHKDGRIFAAGTGGFRHGSVVVV